MGKFFAEIGGIIWELDSVGEYVETAIACFLGKIAAWILVGGLIALGLYCIF